MAKTRKMRGNSKNASKEKKMTNGHMHRHSHRHGNKNSKTKCNFIGCKINDLADVFHKTNLFTTRIIRGSEIKHNYSVRKGLSQHPM